LVTLNSRRPGYSTITLSIILLFLASSFLASSILERSVPAAYAQPRVPIQASSSGNATKVSITPSAITSGQVGSQVTFGVNISLTPAITSFYVTLEYDNAVLNALSVDYSTGIFGPHNPFVNYDCINGQPQAQASCPQNPPGNGVDEIAVQLLLVNPVNGTSGLLFNVNFQVLKNGVANVHIEQVVLALVSQVLPTVTFDGYFSNQQCGAALCRPLQVSFNYTAVPTPISQRPVKFNATAVDPNGAAISMYQWRWGEPVTSGATSTFTTQRATNHTFQNPGQYFVTLIVNDTDGITGYSTQSLIVGRLWVQLEIGSFSANPSSQVVSGTRVNVTVSVQNLGTTNQTALLSVVLVLGDVGNQSLINQTCTLLHPNNACSSSIILDTTGFKPKVYRVIADAQLPAINSTFFMNDTSASSHSAYIQILQPILQGSLSVAQVAGIGIGVLVVAYAAFFVVQRLARRNPEESM
jgi:hypothetical protein